MADPAPGRPKPGGMREVHRGATAAVSEGWMAGGSFFGSVMAGTLLGWLADRWLDTDPWLVVAGAVAGSVAGFYRMWDLIRTPTGKQPRPAASDRQADRQADQLADQPANNA